MWHARHSSLQLAQAKRPLIYAGGGVIAAEAAQALREFTDAFGIPVTTTLMGIGAANTMQPLSLHMLGMPRHGVRELRNPRIAIS